MDLLRFMYTEALPPEASRNLQRATDLLILADRFEVEECVVACARELKSLLPITSSKDAILVLALPQSLQEDPRLKEVIDAANLFLVIHSSVAMHQAGSEYMKHVELLHPDLSKKREAAYHHAALSTAHSEEHQASDNALHRIILAVFETLHQGQQYTRQARQEFLEYSEAAMQAVLESKRLQGDSEDSVASAALAWAMHRGTSPHEVLNTLVSFVLPRLCLRSLSPRLLQGLLSLLKSCSSSKRLSQQLAPILSGSVVDEAAPPLSPDMAPSTPRAATTKPLSHSPEASPRASQPHASRTVRQSDNGAARATSQGEGAGRATSPGVGPSRPHDPLVGRVLARYPFLAGAPRACHPSCSAFLATGRDVLPLCITMCQGATARPEAVAAALGVLADALVDLSEQNLVRTGVLASPGPGSWESLAEPSFRMQRAQAPLLLPPRSVPLPSGCLYLDVPWRIAGVPLIAMGYPASNSNLVVTTPDVFASGRWLKLAVYLNSSHSSPRLEMHLEKRAEMHFSCQSAPEAGTQWRFCLQTSSSQPAFESYASGTLSDQERSTCVGSIPLDDTRKSKFFSQNMIRMRVDTWSA